MAVDYSKISDADLEALQAQDYASLSDEGLAALSGGDQAPAPPTAPAAPDTREGQRAERTSNLTGALQGMLGVSGSGGQYGNAPTASSDAAGATLAQASSGAGGDFLQGLGRDADSVANGVKQIFSDPVAAQSIAKEEERARAKYDKLDNAGFGAEDLGQNALLLGSLLLPGAAAGVVAKAPAAVAGLGMKAINGLSGTAGGTAVLAGLGAMLKGTTPDESRVVNAGETAAATALLGYGGAGVAALGRSKAGQKVGGIIGSIFTDAAGGQVLSKSAARTLSEKVGRVIGNIFSGPRETRDVVADAVGKAKASVIRQSQATQEKLIVDEARSTSRGMAGYPPRANQWNVFEDLTKAFLQASKGTTKYAKENGYNRLNEATTTIMALKGKAMVKSPAGETILDPKILQEEWAKLRGQKAFTDLFGTGNSGKAMKEIDAFVSSVGKNPAPTTGADIFQSAMESAVATRDKTLHALDTAVKLPEPVKAAAKQKLLEPFAAYLGASLQEQGTTPADVAASFSGPDGLINQMNFHLTTQQQFEKYKAEQAAKRKAAAQ